MFLSILRNSRILLAMPPIVVLRASEYIQVCIYITNSLHTLSFFKPIVLLYPCQTTAGQEPHLSQNGGMDDRPSHWLVVKCFFVYCFLMYFTQNPGGIQLFKDMDKHLI